MRNMPKSIAVLAAAAALLSACGANDSDNTANAVPSTFGAPGAVVDATGGSGGAPATVDGGAGSGSKAGDSGDGADHEDEPATAGNGKCLDLQSAVVRNAVAGLPPYSVGSQQIGYGATKGTDSALGDCPDLMWVHADLQGGTGSSPEWTLFFGKQGYLGTATSKPTSFTQVVGGTKDTVAVAYRWLNYNDATANPTGGPVVVRYTLKGRTVVADRDVPAEVWGGVAGEPTTKATPTPATRPPATRPPATPTPAPAATEPSEATPVPSSTTATP